MVAQIEQYLDFHQTNIRKPVLSITAVHVTAYFADLTEDERMQKPKRVRKFTVYTYSRTRIRRKTKVTHAIHSWLRYESEGLAE